MPHIHTEPGQHDMTISAYIVRVDGDEPRALVHMHRKLGKLMQIGGHIEVDETPWQTVAHELSEESGYGLDELQILQPDAQQVEAEGVVVHPLPVLFNTHMISDTHYHSDLCFAFVATAAPMHAVADGESADLRWLTLSELKQSSINGEAAKDVAVFYEAIINRFLENYERVPASQYSIEKPQGMSL